jgi:hypothetical protein
MFSVLLRSGHPLLPLTAWQPRVAPCDAGEHLEVERLILP